MTDETRGFGWDKTKAENVEVEPTPVTDAPERMTVRCTVDQFAALAIEAAGLREAIREIVEAWATGDESALRGAIDRARDFAPRGRTMADALEHGPGCMTEVGRECDCVQGLQARIAALEQEGELDAPERTPVTSAELMGALDDPEVRKAVRIPGVTDWYEDRIAALKQEAEDWSAKETEARQEVARLEQEREVLRGTLFRAEGVIKAYAPYSPVLDAIDRALTKGKNDG